MIESKQIYQRFLSNGLIILIIIPTILLSQGSPKGGCTDESACNYDPGATDDDGSCLFEFDDCGACGGVSECSGKMVQGQCVGVADMCETCDNNPSDDCVQDCFNVGQFNDNGFDCAGWCMETFSYGSDECYDCADTPYGDAKLDYCGICSGGTTELSPNICEGEISGDGQCSNVFDGPDFDCSGTCFGSSVLDGCGVCDGDGFSCQYGCTNENATNYYCDVYTCENGQLPEGFLDDSTCTYNVEGIIIYFAPFQLLQNPIKPIKDVIVTLFAQPVGAYGQPNGEVYTINTTVTNNDGEFMFDNVPSNYIDYYFEFSYIESTNNNHLGIQGNDAQLISQVVVSESSFEVFNDPIHSYIAADVNLDGRINSYDSSLIGRFTNDSSFSMNESNTRWKFVSGMDAITNLTDNENIVIYGIKLGDPNGSWE
jgi:hypothetical protein